MSKSNAPKLVIALFTFKGSNNDELCFRKGDIITITQTDDGGWWEGTLNEKTAWFPSNYVKECRAIDIGQSSVKLSPERNQDLPLIHSRVNRDIVLKDFVDSERAYVAEIQAFVNNFLQPLELTNILKKEEYQQLIGNIQDVLEVHQRLLVNLEATAIQGPHIRVGNLFLTFAAKLKSVHVQYCKGHPQAVCIMDQYRDDLNDFMERTGAITPGILVLVTGLSRPFRRLEKYASMLQELERHTAENHFDRGDTQRSVYVYREITEKCHFTRKQKELALQILTCGIKGWEGEDLNSLGEILHVGPVKITVGTNRCDRYFVLFPVTLLVLSTSPRMSSFVYEGKLPLTGIDILLIDDTEGSEMAFEISGPFIETIMVLCNNREECRQWIDLLSHDQSSSRLLRSSRISRTQLNGKHQQRLQERTLFPETQLWWGLAALRPAPPIYPIKIHGKATTDADHTSRYTSERTFEEDAIVLKVIEGYCMIANRFTMLPELVDRSPTMSRLSVMNDINMDAGDNCSLPEAVVTLRDQMRNLRTQLMELTKQLDEEKQLRQLLTAAVKRKVPGIESLVP